jgi:Tat protein secretion system quality control protein TatD with DNase activity
VDNIISIKNNSRINKVSRIINITRDMRTISRMENLWNNKKSIFAVFGGVHPIMQENLLKDLLK